MGQSCRPKTRAKARVRGINTLSAALAISLLFGVFLSACGAKPGPTPAGQTPGINNGPIDAKSSAAVVDQFLRAWQESRFEDMYELISASSKGSITKERFVQRYRAIADEATIQAVSYTIPKITDANALEVPYTVTITTSFLGNIAENHRAAVVKEGDWRISWTPSQIFSELTGDNLIHLFYTDQGRGAILDRKGKPLAMDVLVPSVGIIPGQIYDRQSLIQMLSKMLSMDPETVKARISVQANPDWFVPVKVLPYDTPEKMIDELMAIPGVIVRKERSRYYPYGAIASQVVGYVTKANADDLKRLGAQGYTDQDWIGRGGVEQSEEALLAGKKGGKLTIVNAAGTVQKVIAEKASTPPADVYVSIDIEFQKKVESLLGDQMGSLVVMDPRDNSILALASKPTFDPNTFIRGVTADEWKTLSDPEKRPLVNRAVAGTYPPGSLFKVVTMAAGLEKGGYTPSSTFACTPTWSGLGPGTVMANWRPDDQGIMDFPTGLAESCNPVFYEVGKKLDQINPDILPTFARSFGLGKATDVEGLDEASGLVPDPSWKKSTKNQPWYAGDTVNMAIGQGFLLVTPLQMVNLFSSVVTGQLRTPVLVQKTVRNEQTLETFSAVKRSDLPVSPASLAAIKQGMVAVVNDPRGTAYATFQGFTLKAAGKSGTAEDEGKDSHAWFVTFAPADNPQIVALVMLEEGGMGSKNAGPIARKTLETYFAK